MPGHQTSDAIEAAVKSLDALLSSIENPPSAAAVVAFKAAITRHGRQLAASAGPDALAAVLKRVRDEAADKARADVREATLRGAWQGIAGREDQAA